MEATATTNIPADEFRIDEDGHLVRAVWPTYEDEARVEFGPGPGLARRCAKLAGLAQCDALFPRRPALDA